MSTSLRRWVIDCFWACSGLGTCSAALFCPKLCGTVLMQRNSCWPCECSSPHVAQEFPGALVSFPDRPCLARRWPHRLLPGPWAWLARPGRTHRRTPPSKPPTPTQAPHRIQNRQTSHFEVPGPRHETPRPHPSSPPDHSSHPAQNRRDNRTPTLTSRHWY